MQLIIITRPDFFLGEAAFITGLFRNGLATLHLRKPQSPPQEILQLLTEIPSEFYPRIVLHDNFSMTNDFPLKGVHLNGRNPLPPVNYKGHISRSCHSLEEVKLYKKTCNYVFLSPICDSISKEGYQASFTEKELKEAADRGIIDKKVIALGGINAAHLPQLKQWHFGGAAFLGDVWQHTDSKDFISHFLKLKTICDNLR